eukprot:GAHX01001140.1.p1 GENE.GAHX01001140.1~~GAHX01001140.1.p1  ORF type:complete len:445 (+),score=77.56 GAHX01001140.1:31-1335(+)
MGNKISSLTSDNQNKSKRKIKNQIQRYIQRERQIPDVLPNQPCKLRLDRLQRLESFLNIEREFISNHKEISIQLGENTENSTIQRLEKRMLEDIRGKIIPIVTVNEIFDDNHAIISSTFSPTMYVGISSIVDKNKLKNALNASVLMNRNTYDIVGILDDDEDPAVTVMKIDRSPNETFASIGGLKSQIQEIKEAIEFPLTRPEIYEEIGIKPPKGVIFYGPPGTGKTLMAKAVASETSATFLRLVGSELIQKYLGEGPKLVRKLFQTAVECAPSIVFIDEIDAIGLKRTGDESGGKKEIQRTMLELLNQLDGFDDKSEVKVILATNRIEALDPALIRPGRIDRKIEFPRPDENTRREIFRILTSKMKLEKDVELEEFVKSKNDFSGAEIQAICTEAGLLALRERRMVVNHEDFKNAVDTAIYKKKNESNLVLYA